VQGDVFVEPLKERDSAANQDRHDRIAHFVGQSAAQAFAGYVTTSDKPDVAEVRLQSLVHQAFEVAAVELNGIPGLPQLATGQDEGRLAAVGPTQPFCLEIQRGFIGSRTHDVAVDGAEELLDGFLGQRLSTFKVV
jgi:hypothetical protein